MFAQLAIYLVTRKASAQKRQQRKPADGKSREKVLFNIRKSREVNDPELFKKLTPDIWEFRTLFNNRKIRLLAFWDTIDGKQAIVVATHGFIKKTRKTPSKEIERALQLRKEYLDNK